MEPVGTLVPLADTGRTVADPAQDVRGRPVVDSDGSEIGTVADLLVDPDRETVRYLRVEHGGILGFGASASFIPVDAIREVTDERVYVETSKERIAGAPRYEPELADQREFYEEISGYYGHLPYWAPDYFYPGFPRRKVPHG
jgi:sporulation protein YlmC with PRC-barrel domain